MPYTQIMHGPVDWPCTWITGVIVESSCRHGPRSRIWPGPCTRAPSGVHGHRFVFSMQDSVGVPGFRFGPCWLVALAKTTKTKKGFFLGSSVPRNSSSLSSARAICNLNEAVQEQTVEAGPGAIPDSDPCPDPAPAPCMSPAPALASEITVISLLTRCCVNS